MDVFSLSRNWFDFAFENPEKISPTHAALFFFCIEHCNRLGWKEKFGLPTSMAKEAIGIKNYRTYQNAINDLVDWGFVKMVEKSKNQHSSNIVAIVKNAKATTKALDKALHKHAQKQRISTVSIDIQETLLQETIIQESDFETFWNEYHKLSAKPKTDRAAAEKKWKRLSSSEKDMALKMIPAYVGSVSEKKYIKKARTYLEDQNFNDEFMPKSATISYNMASQTTDDREYIMAQINAKK